MQNSMLCDRTKFSIKVFRFLGWSCETAKQLSGVTQTCRAQQTGTANFCYLFDLQLSFDLEVLQSETG
jgi:hypothetical protein